MKKLHSIRDFLSFAWDSIQKEGVGYDSSDSEQSLFQGSFKEILNFSNSIENPLTRVVDSSDFNLGFATSRLFYLIRGVNTLEEIAFYAPKSADYSDDGIHLFGSSYGYKIFGDDRFWRMVQKLKITKNSKRLYFPVFTQEDFLRDSKDIPCVIGVLLQPRDTTLNLTLQMRANDVQKLLPYNLFEFSMLHECLSVASGMDLGSFGYTAGTMHLRGEKDIAKSTNPWDSVNEITMQPMQHFDKNVLNNILSSEEQVRNEIPNLTQGFYPAFVESVISRHNSYWSELLLILCDYGYTVFHKQNPPVCKGEDERAIYRLYISNKK